MGKTVIFDTGKEFVGKVAEDLVNRYDDNVMVIAPFAGSMSTHAPSKKGKSKGYHRLKLEVWIPEDAIKGEDCLNDFGAFAVMRLPKSRVQDHLLNESKVKGSEA